MKGECLTMMFSNYTLALSHTPTILFIQIEERWVWIQYRGTLDAVRVSGGSRRKRREEIWGIYRKNLTWGAWDGLQTSGTAPSGRQLHGRDRSVTQQEPWLEDSPDKWFTDFLPSSLLTRSWMTPSPEKPRPITVELWLLAPPRPITLELWLLAPAGDLNYTAGPGHHFTSRLPPSIVLYICADPFT